MNNVHNKNEKINNKVMSGDDCTVVALAETTRPFVKSVRSEEPNRYTKKTRRKRQTREDDKSEEEILLQRLPSYQPSLSSLDKLRNSFRKLNCLRNSRQEEDMPMMEVPRHKSIDIGVGLARRVSLFLFTKRTVCVHPYHPFTPEQTTRKIYISTEEKESTKKR